MDSTSAKPNQRPNSGGKLRDYLGFRYQAFRMKGRKIYSPLHAKTKEFRLLELYPGKGSDHVRCFLRTVSLLSSQCPTYETISYAWGDPTDHAEIEINGTLFPVPKSSMLAVARMRYSSRNRTLWIDAVCIDQNNLDERAEQVVLMKDIYGKSSRNLVYLGEEDDSTASAFKSIMAISNEIQQEVADISDFRATIVHRATRVEQTSSTGFKANLDFESLMTFYSRPYFRRLWVTQETLLAPCNLCHCGSHEMGLLDIFRASIWLRYKVLFIPNYVYNCVDERMLRWWDNLERKPTLTANKFFSNVRVLLDFTQGRETSDERDRVFALISLLRGDVPNTLKPDYRASAHDILREATRHCFLYDGYVHCKILGRSHHDEHSDLDSRSRPSWVRRWDDSVITTGVVRSDFQAHGRQSVGYKLSTAEEDAFWNPKDRNELLLKGFVADTVERHSSVLTIDEVDNVELLMKWIDNVELLTDTSLDGAIDEQNYTLLDVLIAGNSAHVDKATEADVLDGYHLLRFLRSKGIPRVSLLQSSKHEEAAACRYYNSMRYSCANRLVICTPSGRIGLGPFLTRASDVVAILCGCPWPVILRPVEENLYKFVGVCYVHGIMFGEAV